MPSEDIVRAAQKGDSQAFSQLLETSYETIYRVSLHWAGNVPDAEDIAQLVCMKLAKSIRQFRFESAFTTWLYRVVINCARDWARSGAKHNVVNDGSLSCNRQHDTCNDGQDFLNDRSHEVSASDAPALEAESELRRVIKIVATMGDDYKETLLLVFGEGFSHAEAGETLGIKESTVSWRIHEIRKRLQQDKSKEVSQ
ncbi:MAG: RNA polymerase sigma-70 factor (ECF subfamily) [Flavobacteriales bacterium]|jgi:RNA polymerase sigma-70 factor (ECF subfamily)